MPYAQLFSTDADAARAFLDEKESKGGDPRRIASARAAVARGTAVVSDGRARFRPQSIPDDERPLGTWRDGRWGWTESSKWSVRRRIQDAFEGKPRKDRTPKQQAESRAEPAPASDEAHSEPQDEPRTGRKEVLKARRQCFQCKRKLPEGMHGPKQWNGECKGGWAKRVCLKCRPDSAPHGYRFCTRCEKLKTVDAFSKHYLKSNNIGGMFQRVCKSRAQRARISSTPRLSG